MSNIKTQSPRSKDALSSINKSTELLILQLVRRSHIPKRAFACCNLKNVVSFTHFLKLYMKK